MARLLCSCLVLFATLPAGTAVADQGATLNFRPHEGVAFARTIAEVGSALETDPGYVLGLTGAVRWGALLAGATLDVTGMWPFGSASIFLGASPVGLALDVGRFIQLEATSEVGVHGIFYSEFFTSVSGEVNTWLPYVGASLGGVVWFQRTHRAGIGLWGQLRQDLERPRREVTVVGPFGGEGNAKSLEVGGTTAMIVVGAVLP